MCNHAGSCGTTGVDESRPEISLVTIQKAFREVEEKFGQPSTEIRMKQEFYDKFRKECSDIAAVGQYTVISKDVKIPTVIGMSVIIDDNIDRDWRIISKLTCFDCWQDAMKEIDMDMHECTCGLSYPAEDKTEICNCGKTEFKLIKNHLYMECQSCGECRPTNVEGGCQCGCQKNPGG